LLFWFVVGSGGAVCLCVAWGYPGVGTGLGMLWWGGGRVRGVRVWWGRPVLFGFLGVVGVAEGRTHRIPPAILFSGYSRVGILGRTNS